MQNTGLGPIIFSSANAEYSPEGGPGTTKMPLPRNPTELKRMRGATVMPSLVSDPVEQAAWAQDERAPARGKWWHLNMNVQFNSRP